jgi:hypothetical protein
MDARAEGNLEGRMKKVESVNPCLTGSLSKTYRDSDRWGDASDLLGEIYSVRGDKAKGRKWLKKAVGCRKDILDPKVKDTEGKLRQFESAKLRGEDNPLPTKTLLSAVFLWGAVNVCP